MKRRIVTAGLFLVLGCTGEASAPHDDHEPEVSVSGTGLAEQWTREGDHLVSPPLDLEEPAVRVAAMLTLSSRDDDAEDLLEAAGSDGEWLPLERVFGEEELAVVRADLSRGSKSVRLRVPVAAAERIALLTFTASNPEMDESAEIDSSSRGLAADLANAGILPRSAWGARARRCSTNDRAKVRMAIHHSVTGRLSGGAFEPVLRQIQSFHMDGRGYCDVGYHFFVTADGRVWEARDVGTVGGHSYNYNGGNIGIVFVGCFDSSGTCNNLGGRDVPEAMMAGAARAIRTLSQRHGIAIDADRSKGPGQQPYQQTACPGDSLRGRLEELRNRARNAGNAPPPPPPPPAAHPPRDATAACGLVGSNELLARGARMKSCNGLYDLVHQTDGNVVLYNTWSGSAVWSTGTHGRATSIFIMQHDGNLVLYAPGGAALWSSGTHGRYGAFLGVQDDGNVVIYAPGAVWSTNTVGAGGTPPPPPGTCGALVPDRALGVNDSLTSCSGRYLLVHQGDGNVVLYNTANGSALWATGTNGRATSTFVMQGDGNLVLYGPGGAALWSSGTHGNLGAWLAVQDDGNAVIYTGNRPLFATGTAGR